MSIPISDFLLNRKERLELSLCEMLTKSIILCSLLAFTQAGGGYNYGHQQNIGQATQSHPVHVKAEHSQGFHGSSPLSGNDGVERQFFYFNAPAEKFEDGKALQQLASESKRHQQIIFIKPPEQKGYEKALRDLAQASSEQKTHIYVLSKERDTKALAKKLQSNQQFSQRNSKPEVHFVKYKTPSEAHHIQNSVIHQHGGRPSEVHDLSGGSSNVNRQYLAPNIF